MILNFQKNIKGTPTHFTEKVWECILRDSVPCDKKEMEVTLKALESVRNYEVGTFNPKRHTIRLDAANRWDAGCTIHPYQWSGRPRQSTNVQFAPALKCTSVQDIEIINPSEYLTDTIVRVDGRKLSTEEMQQLAWNDGFENLAAFQLYFDENAFKGKIIHWTNLKY